MANHDVVSSFTSLGSNRDEYCFNARMAAIPTFGSHNNINFDIFLTAHLHVFFSFHCCPPSFPFFSMICIYLLFETSLLQLHSGRELMFTFLTNPLNRTSLCLFPRNYYSGRLLHLWQFSFELDKYRLPSSFSHISISPKPPFSPSHSSISLYLNFPTPQNLYIPTFIFQTAKFKTCLL